MKSVDSKFPQVLTIEGLKEKGAEQIEDSTFFSLIIDKEKGVYEPDYESGVDGEYKRYILRRTIEVNG